MPTDAETVEKQNEQKESVEKTAPHEYAVAYRPTPVAAGDYRNVPGDWKTAKGSSRKTLTEIRQEQFEKYRETREKTGNTKRENPPEDYFKGEVKVADELEEKIQELEAELAEVRAERDKRDLNKIVEDGVKAQVEAAERVYGPLNEEEKATPVKKAEAKK